jgi:hypothetical protein
MRRTLAATILVMIKKAGRASKYEVVLSSKTGRFVTPLVVGVGKKRRPTTSLSMMTIRRSASTNQTDIFSVKRIVDNLRATKKVKR